MEAKELRIGNLVSIDGETREVTAVEGDVIDVYTPLPFTTENHGEECVEGIALNGEWLLKFGFEKNYDGDYVKDFRIFNLCFDNMLDCYYDAGRGWAQFAFKSNVEIKYVHQLQNLYFALTGKEIDPTI